MRNFSGSSYFNPFNQSVKKTVTDLESQIKRLNSLNQHENVDFWAEIFKDKTADSNIGKVYVLTNAIEGKNLP